MKPEQIEDARMMLREALHAAANSCPGAATTYVRDALAALNSEQEEEWGVGIRCGQFNPFKDGTFVAVGSSAYAGAVAVARDEATARRIARLPALERAARRMDRAHAAVRYTNISPDWVELRDAADALRAALTDKAGD